MKRRLLPVSAVSALLLLCASCGRDHFKNRNELKAYIESQGGKVAGSVSGSTSFLINNDVTSTSGKNKKAQELHIPILSEDDFMERFGSAAPQAEQLSLF